MKSYWIRHEAGQASLDLRELPIPEPARGQMVLRVRATSLNRGDLLGAIAFHRAAEGRPAGVDAAGEVYATGEGVRDFKRWRSHHGALPWLLCRVRAGGSRARNASPAAVFLGAGGRDTHLVRHRLGSASCSSAG
jgi:NADPH:quinone reductase-like Zn-dependent oxidoreductase